MITAAFIIRRWCCNQNVRIVVEPLPSSLSEVQLCLRQHPVMLRDTSLTYLSAKSQAPDPSRSKQADRWNRGRCGEDPPEARNGACVKRKASSNPKMTGTANLCCGRTTQHAHDPEAQVKKCSCCAELMCSGQPKRVGLSLGYGKLPEVGAPANPEGCGGREAVSTTTVYNEALWPATVKAHPNKKEPLSIEATLFQLSAIFAHVSTGAL